jgi:Tfp pilus assembly protein PilV
MRRRFLKSQDGFSLVEAVLSAALFVLVVAAFAGGIIYGRESAATAGDRARAVFLAEEGLEAVRNIRDASFSNLSAGTKGVSTSSGYWSFSGISDVFDNFTRSISIATEGTNIKNVTSTVTWKETPARTGSVTLTSRFTEWLSSPIGNWATPFQAASLNLSGAQDGLKVQAQGNYAYVVRNDGTPDFLIINTSSSTAPSIIGSLSLTDAPVNIFVSGNYAYVSSRSDTQELQIIDISNPASPSVAGTYNATGTADGLGVYVVGLYAYLTRAGSADNEFFIIDISNPSSPSLFGSLDLGDGGYEVWASGNYAYVASAHNTQELQAVNVSNPASPFLAGYYDLSGNTDAITVTGMDDILFLGSGNSVYVFLVTNPSSPALQNSYNSVGTTNDIGLNIGAETDLYLATSGASTEFRIIDILDLANPSALGSYDVSGNVALYGVAYNQSADRAYGVGSSDTEEFIIFAPAP